MTRRQKVTAEQLAELGAKVSKLVQVTTNRLDRLEDTTRAALASQGAVIEDLSDQLAGLRNTTAPGLAESINISTTAPELPELNDTPDSFAADLENAGAPAETVAWDITSSGAQVYSAGGKNAIDTLEALLFQMLRDGNSDPAIIDLHVGFAGVDPEDGLSFDGLLTVAV